MREKPTSAGFGCAHGALVGFGPGRTRTVTVSAILSRTASLTTSVTTSVNTRSVRTDGAVNLGDAVAAPLSVTDTPPVCAQR